MEQHDTDELAEIQLTSALLERVPVFPLPRAVLFPGVVVPLHLFEPRYRAMATYCIDSPGHKLMALATLSPGYEADYEGRPAIEPVMGVGQIVAHQRLEDGRWNVAVRGLARTKLASEWPPSTSFRLGRLTLLPEHERPSDGDDAARLVTMVLQLGARQPTARPQLTQLIRAASSPARVADVVAGLFVESLALRQRLIGDGDVQRRLSVATDLIGRLLLEGGDEDGGVGPSLN